jgi:hypothetical protein
MGLKYLRFRLFTALLRPFSRHARLRRMRAYARLMRVRDGMSVLDLGGQPAIWQSLPGRLDITILNLPGVAEHTADPRIRYVEGDACRVGDLQRGQFDTVFSNSVIEHVGGAEQRSAFAREVRRLGRSYWVQTPAKWFPIEAHCGMPFWWFYPARLRRWFIARWRGKLPAWTEMVEQTSLVERAELQALFPEARIRVETFCGLPKSYIAYFPGSAA